MGQACSRRAAPQDPVVLEDAPEQVVDVKPVISISGRYTNIRKVDDDYMLSGKVLGSGMSGPVKLAVNKKDGRKYAIKSFSKRGLQPGTFTDFKNEAELYLTLDHPHITHLEMVYEDGDMLHLVMEHMAGGELYDRVLASQQYTEEKAADTIQQMLLAVAYLHARYVAHRDLKLENFLYEREDADHLKLIDFGFAKFWDEHTRMTRACGSVHYVAPEVLNKSYTVQADMWSLGILSYMLLLGSPPFHGTDTEIMQSIRSEKLSYSSRFPQLSESAQSFVKSLLVFDPTMRLSAQEALEHAWISGRRSAAEQAVDVSILRDLRNFTHASHFRRAILSMAARSLSSDDIANLREQFLLMDKSRSGKVTYKDLKVIVENNVRLDRTAVETLFNTLPADCEKEFEYSDFLSAALLGRVEVNEVMLSKTFSKFDKDGNGFISKDELQSVLGGSFDEHEISNMIRDVDTSGDGEIDYYEFVSYFQKSDNGDADVPHSGQPVLRKQRTEELVVAIDQLLDASEPHAVDTSGDGETHYYESSSESESCDSDVPLSGKPVLRKRRTEELDVAIDQLLDAAKPHAGDASGDGETNYYESTSESESGDSDVPHSGHESTSESDSGHSDVPHSGQPMLRKRRTEELGVAIDQLLNAAMPHTVATTVQERQSQEKNRSDAPDNCSPVLLGAKRSNFSDWIVKR